jgi:hypothetical protein
MKKLLLAAVMLAALAGTAQADDVPTEPAEFKNNSVITFTEPTLGCRSSDDAAAAYKQTAEWAAARDCKNLDTNIKWVVINGGSEYQKYSVRNTVTYGCVVPQARWNQTNATLQSRDVYHLGMYSASMTLDKECWHVVRRIDQVRARSILPTCTDPLVMDTLRRVVRAKEVQTLKEVESNGLDGQRWCYATFSAPYPGPNGSNQEVSFTLEWMGKSGNAENNGRWWLQVREQYRTSPLGH